MNFMKENVNKEKVNNFVNKHYKKILIILLILIFFSRIYEFGKIPTAVGVDEAAAIYDGYCIANYNVDRYLNSYPVYLINFGGGQSSLYAYLIAILINLFGNNLLIYRLPLLIISIVSIIVLYMVCDKFKNKKTSLLFAFLIIIFPWHISSSRYGLDCNLLFGFMAIDIYIISIAKRNYQYILAGIFIGLTLYTYVLSYIIVPIFLGLWILYNIYIKNIKLKQIIIMGIPILILAIPLIYMILLNNGIFTKTNFGFITIPKLFEYRGNEISISNIFTNGLNNIKELFINKNAILIMPLFIIGIISSIIKIKKSINQSNKKYDLDIVMIMSFISVFTILILIENINENRVNPIFISILYFAAVGISYLLEKIDIIAIVIIGLFIISFLIYEINYYNIDGMYSKNIYEEKDLYEVAIKIEENEVYKNYQKYIMTFQTARPEIYFMLAEKISPYVFDETKKEEIYDLSKNNKYHFIRSYRQHYFVNTYTKIDFSMYENEKNIIFIIDKYYYNIINEFKNNNYKEEQYGKYFIFTK